MSIQLQEIQSIYISQNRLVEGKDYVRAEWLKGDNTAYIDTLIYPAFGDELSADFTLSAKPKVTNVKILVANDGKTNVGFGTGGAWYKDNIPQLLVINNNNTYNSGSYIQYSRFSYNPDITEYYLYMKLKNGELPDSILKVDGVPEKRSAVGENCIITQVPSTTYLIGRSQTTSGLDTVKIRNVNILHKLFLVPCQLLQDIPATLDANGIARTTGECGMVDSISGKFYGNVASSGSFSVEGLDESGTVEDTRLHQIYTNKLVENVDYRCYDWIERESSAMGEMFTVNNIPTTPTYVRLWNYKTQGSNGRDMIYCGGSKIYIYPNNSQSEVIYRTSGGSTGTLTTEQDFELKIERNEINDISFASMGAYWTYIVICPSTATGNLTKVGRIYSDKYDYVPCKLLRDIPANRTMNGKSYPAGTMGMIEKVSKKFQPIANAATLTVSYDEWLKDCSIQIAIPECYAFGYTTRVDTTKLTSELVDFGFIKLSNTQIVYGDEDDGVVYTVDWGTNKWATLNIIYNRGAVATILNGTTVRTAYNIILDQNPHIQLYDIMQIKQIDWSVMVDNIATTTTLTRYVNETTGQQGLISDQDGTIIYAD